MPLPRLLLAGFLLVVGASCSRPTDPELAAALRLSRRPPELVLRNGGTRPIHYIAFEANTAAVTLWGACDDPERCPRVDPGEQELVPYEAVAGYHPGAELALVYWWHLEPKAGGGFRADSIRVGAIRF